MSPSSRDPLLTAAMRCLCQTQTTSGVIRVNRIALLSIRHCLTVGEESPLEASFAGYCSSGLSSAK
eukprot:1932039-Amphidinium_carterae.1